MHATESNDGDDLLVKTIPFCDDKGDFRCIWLRVVSTIFEKDLTDWVLMRTDG